MNAAALQTFAHTAAAFSASCAPGLANHLWQTTAFAALAALLTLTLRGNQARTRHCIWLAASLKFLLPLALVATLGSHFAKPRPAAVAQAAVYTAVEDFSEPIVFRSIPLPQAHVSEARHGAPEFVAAYAPILCVALWLAGFVAIIVTFIIRWRRVARSLRSAQSLLEGREIEILRRLEAAATLSRATPLLLSQTQMEPGVFGILRPVLAWPAGLSERLDDAQLEAVLAHEVAHIRRRDNLTAAAHMLVEAAFWFHPLIWWIGARMVAERERACDEAVLDLCPQPEAYAESILKVCAFCVESPLACVSGITGADLKQRVVDIMTARVARRLSTAKKLLIAAAALCTLAVPILLAQAKATERMVAMIAAAPAPVGTIAKAIIAREDAPPAVEMAQTKPDSSQSTPDAQQDIAAVPFHFEAVSIHPSGPGLGTARRIGFQFTDDGILASNSSLVRILELQYRRELQLDSIEGIAGGPDWVRTQQWDIRAKVADSDQAEWSRLVQDRSNPESEARLNATVRAMLAERFGLKLHSEVKEGTVYALEIADGGPKIKPSTSTKPPNFTIGPGHLSAKGEVAAIATLLAHELGHPIIDKTGLTGFYDFTLDWQPMQGTASSSAGSSGGDTPPAPSLFTAVQEQLGLKLVPQKGPIPHLVIDHADKPSVDGAEVVAPAAESLRAAAGAQGPGTPTVAYVPTMVFDVASVREAKRETGGWFRVEGGFEPANGCHLRFQNFELRNMLSAAYPIDWSQIAGLDALSSDKVNALFNVEARCDPADEQRLEKLDKQQRILEQNHMLQTLLAQRFNLKAHWETRDGKTYDLVVSKAGRLHSTGAPPSAEEIATWGDRGVPPIYQHGDSRTGFEYTAHGATIADIAGTLTSQFGHPVNDKTGLTGKYDFNLKTYGVRASERRDGETNPWPPLDNAIEDQLGLKLVSSHGPIRMLVVDHMEMPTEN